MAAALFGCLCLILLASAATVAANVEKAIFVAGQTATGGAEYFYSGLADVLPRLTPNLNAWRTDLPAAFSWAEGFPDNGTTWMILGDLNAGQRYELRVCWTATQPTAFSVDVYDLTTVATTVELAMSLDNFISKKSFEELSSDHYSSFTSAISLVRIIAAADFVAADRSAMKPDSVPPVIVDVILDPYLLNVLPRSLVPVVVAILAVAAASAWLARRVILPGLQAVALSGQVSEDSQRATRKLE